METLTKTPAQQLATPLQFLRGVGPHRAELLEKLGLRTVKDLLFNFPRDYQDYTQLATVATLVDNATVSLRGQVEEIDRRNTANGGSVLGVLVREALATRDDSPGKPSRAGSVRCLWFNQAYMTDQFQVGQQVLISGKVRQHGLVWEMAHPRVQWLGDDEDPVKVGMLPVYPLTEGLSQPAMRRIMESALPNFAQILEEAFPAPHLEEHELMPLREAVMKIHFPASPRELALARRRFVYQELFVMQLAMAMRRRQRGLQQAPQLEATARVDARIRRLFPFELTSGQEQAIAEVARDMGQVIPMNRLLQGDVGSGKTIVAVYAMLLAIAHGQQAMLMAPSEILARQHEQTLRRLLSLGKVRQGLLVGGLPAGERQALLNQIATGQIDVLVGTQAVLQSDVQFARLGLVVIDESHKFGVRQRAGLKQAALAPHYLVMTATPIPRTVSLTLYGDLDLSVIRDLPPGRQPVKTYLAGADLRSRWWEFYRKQLREGRQGYVIVPLVEESEQSSAAGVQSTFESLANGELKEFRLGLVHGRMPGEEKQATMKSFRDGHTHVLVATTVVEVGVDIPNATLMAIEAADRFGLSQLHQLRGRIGRGQHPGYCCLFTAAENEQTLERLQAFVRTTDGFELAELDFRLRGPGELIGTKQHGLPPLLIADLQRDSAILEECRRDAEVMLDGDPGLSQPQHDRLRRLVLARYGQALDLADVG